MLGVLLGHGDQIRFLAAFRDRDAHLGAMRTSKLAGKPLLHGLGILGHDANDHLVRDGRGGIVVAQQEHVQQILVGNIVPAVEHELVAVDDTTLAHHEHVHAGDGLLAEKPDDIGIKVARAYRMLFVA